MNALSHKLAHDENFAKVLKWLPMVVTALLVMVFAVMLASLFWLVFTPESPLLVTSPAENADSTKSATVKNYGKIVANYHLFGKEEKKATPKPTKIPAPVTRLNLELHGIVAREGEKSYAIIAAGKQAKQKIYTVGGEPQAGVKIDSILPRKIILRHSGKLEELLLPEKKGSSARNAYLPPAAPAPSMGRAATRLPPAGIPPRDAADQLPADDLGALRDVLTNNPDKILEIASIAESKDKDGNLTGFRLSPGKNRQLFRKLGLRPGDVVTAVNGVQLDSPAKGLMVMNELSAAESISITLKRGDQMVTIDKPF